MSLEDHLLSLVKTVKSMAEAVGTTVEKVIDEIKKEEAPKKEEAAQIEMVKARTVLSGGSFTHRGASYCKSIEDPPIVIGQDGNMQEYVAAYQNNNARKLIFNPDCMVEIKKV